MKRLLVMSFVLFAFMANTALAQEKKADKLKLYGDVRFRTELDRDSKKSDGSMRADRDRFRFRFRFGFKYALNENVEFGGRIRSGNPDNAQSPHVTLGDEFNSKDLSIDKAYIKYSSNGFYVWAGKNSMNMWEPDEMLWDGDVNPEGIGLGHKLQLGDNGKLAVNAGYFVVYNTTGIVDGKPKQTFGQHANASFGQLKYCSKIGDNKLVIAPGLLKTYMPGMSWNYNIFSGFILFKTNTGLSMNLDYFKNLADLKDHVDPNFEDQTTGFAGTIGYAFNKKISAKVSYAQIQKYAVVDMFAQDDWVRWGNAVMTRSSNFGGFGVAVKYKLAKNFNTQLKFWNVEGLAKATGASDLETGTRIRWDFNIKF